MPVLTSKVFSRDDDPLTQETSQGSNHLQIPQNDIGKAVNRARDLDITANLQLTESPWLPDESYSFPASGKRNLRFQRSWMARFPWLVYSNKFKGAFCKYCVIFATEYSGRVNQQRLGALVLKPFTAWKDAIEVSACHSKLNFHIGSAVFAEGFVAVLKSKQDNIFSKLDDARKAQANENRMRLKPVVETIVFCGRQQLVLRGTNDHGPLRPEKKEPALNDGNFRALLRMRMRCGDDELKKHVEKSVGNGMYLSPVFAK
jgi:hypothetical protein